MPVITPIGGGGGSALPATATATVTTSPTTFTAPHIFDLGSLAIAQARITFMSGVGDGETFGPAVGQICVLGLWESSSDGVTFAELTPFWGPPFDVVDANGNMSAAAQFEDRCYPTPRYLRVTPTIGDSATSNPYAGPNHPTATLRLDVTYL